MIIASMIDLRKRNSYLSMPRKTINESVNINFLQKYYSKNPNFESAKDLIKSWDQLGINESESFAKTINILEDMYNLDNENNFNYIKNYIIEEVTPKVRDASSSRNYIKMKVARFKTKAVTKVRNNTDSINNALHDTIKDMKNNVKNNVSDIKNAAKGKDKKIPENKLEEAYLSIEEKLNIYAQCDRVTENANKIQKRFNIFNILSETRSKESLINNINTICECVDTYNSPTMVKYNTALEITNYFLDKLKIPHSKKDILTEVTDYFLCRDITSNEISDMKYIISNNKFFTEDDKSAVSYLFDESYTDLEEIAKPLIESNTKNIKNIGNKLLESKIMSSGNLKQILYEITVAYSKEKVPTIMSSKLVELIPELESLYRMDKTEKEQPFSEICKLELKRFKNKVCMENGNAKEYYNMLLSKVDKTPITEDEYINEKMSAISKLKDTKDDVVKGIIDNFKLKEHKKPEDVRTCVSKMYTKSATQIIEGTPNFLSWVRMSFIIGTTSIHPVLGGLHLLIDLFVGMKLKRRDVSKMITVYKNERKIVSNKLKKSLDKNDEKNLKNYDKYLEESIAKLEEYGDSLLSSEEKYAKDSGDEYDKNSDLDFLKDDDSDDEFEYEYFINKVKDATDKILQENYIINTISSHAGKMSSDEIDIFTELACAYPNIIPKKKLKQILNNELNNESFTGFEKYIRNCCINENIKELSNISETYNIDLDTIISIIEYCEEVNNPVIKESASSNLKLAANRIKKSMKKLSDKDKEVSRRVDSTVNNFVSAVQRVGQNENREAIIRGSILPSMSKLVKLAVADGVLGLVNPVIGIIAAVGQIALMKHNKTKERQMILDEIEIELKMCERYLRVAEDHNDLEAQKQILTIQRNLERQQQRIKYNMKVHWKQNVDKPKKDEWDD